MGQHIWKDITSGRKNVRKEKRPEGQNVQRDKTSRGTKLRKTKRRWEQNVRRDKTSGDKDPFGLFLTHIHIDNLKKNTLLNNFEVYFFIYKKKQNHLISLHKKRK
jgi:hypothetical protein